MDFLNYFTRFTKDKKKGLPSSFQVGELVINNINPLGGMFKKGVTKAGRISLAGTLNEVPSQLVRTVNAVSQTKS